MPKTKKKHSICFFFKKNNNIDNPKKMNEKKFQRNETEKKNPIIYKMPIY